MIYKALDKSQDWLKLSSDINTDIDEQFIRKKKTRTSDKVFWKTTVM